MNYNVTLKEIPERYVASVRSVIPAYNQEGILWRILAEETKTCICCRRSHAVLAVFHDKGFKDIDADVEIQTSVKGSCKDPEALVTEVCYPIKKK